MVTLTRDALKNEIEKGIAEVSEHTYGKPQILYWGEPAKVTIGKYCSIANQVRIFLGRNLLRLRLLRYRSLRTSV